MKTVDFYFDFLSPFAYLASEAIEQICERNAARLVFQPVLFPALLNHWGQRGPAEIAPKAVHTLKQCVRLGRVQGVPLRSPMFHPFRPLTALRACLVVSELERPGVVHTLFRHGWAQGGDLGNDQALGEALNRAGYDGSSIIARAQEPEVKQRLADNTASAIARGVFGVPSVLIDEELFWGVDQLPFIELYLQGRDPLAEVEVADIAPRGIGAWRPGVPPRA